MFVTPRPSHRPRQYPLGGNRAASAYGTFVAASDTSPEKMVHGTFLISPEGTIEWANTVPQSKRPHRGGRTGIQSGPFGSQVTIIVQDGRVLQIDRTDRQRLPVDNPAVSNSL